MREVPLNKGKVALVDDEDYERVMRNRWCLSSSGYARRAPTKAEREAGVTGRNLRMHRWLIDAPAGLDVDHIDGNRLNNQKANLRLATRSQNTAHSGKRPSRATTGPTSRFKGVRWHREAKRWWARVGYQNQRFDLGFWDIEEDAARAYDRKALELFGAFAVLNFPEEYLSEHTARTTQAA